MATDRDRLKHMQAIKRDQKQGLQQILEPSASVKLSSSSTGQGAGNQAQQQKIRRQTIYTRTELLNRSVPTTQKNTTVMPQIPPLLAGPGNATLPTMPPRQRTCLGLNRTLTRMRTVIDLKPYPSPIKKTPNELNLPQLDIIPVKGSKIPIFDRSRNRDRFLEQRVVGGQAVDDKSPNQMLTRMRTDMDLKVKPSYDWRFPESEGVMRPSRLPVLNISRYREGYTKQLKEEQLTKEQLKEEQLKKEQLEEQLEEQLRKEQLKDESEPYNNNLINDIEITEITSRIIPLPEDPEELPLSKPLSPIPEEMNYWSPSGSPEHGIKQIIIPENMELQE